MFFLKKFIFNPPKPTYTSNKENLISIGTVPALFLPYDKAKTIDPTRPLILFFHGNAEDLGSCEFLLKELQFFLKIDILAVEYPGYGIFYGNTTAEQIKQVSLLVFDYLTNQLRFPKENIIVLGKSIGSGPACYLAGNREPGALILISPFKTIKDVISWKSYNILNMFTISEEFENSKEIAKVHCPILLLHGKVDNVIPFEHSEYLENIVKAKNKKVFSVYPNFMNHNFFHIQNDIALPIIDFLGKAGYYKQDQEIFSKF